MVEASARELEDTDFEGLNLSQADFTDAPATGGTIEAGEVEEVMRAEVGEDGVFASYDLIRVGDSLDATGNSAQGKIFMAVKTSGDVDVDPRTEVRFITRPKNSNRIRPLTEFIPVRDLDRDDPRQRRPLPPVRVDGKPAYVKEGRILAVEARNPATSIDVSRTNTDMDVPARGGY